MHLSTKLRLPLLLASVFILVALGYLPRRGLRLHVVFRFYKEEYLAKPVTQKDLGGTRKQLEQKRTATCPAQSRIKQEYGHGRHPSWYITDWLVSLCICLSSKASQRLGAIRGEQISTAALRPGGSDGLGTKED